MCGLGLGLGLVSYFALYSCISIDIILLIILVFLLQSIILILICESLTPPVFQFTGV